MSNRLIVDLNEGGVVQVSALKEGGLPLAADAPMSWPLGADALEDLRWYLEDYLRTPFGVYEDRGGRVREKLSDWGHSVFSSVFNSGAARDIYRRMRAQGDVELVFRSASSELLGLPWELMADPGRSLPLAMDIAGVSRSLPVTPDAAQAVPVPGGRLRVLMVISRPAGTGDVGYRMVGRSLLERLEAVRGAVELVVLRPPTLDALRTELVTAADAGEPYQVVHFDGHGAFLGQRNSDVGEGVLVFERPEGGPHYVPAAVIARALADAKVPVVVLNACQSGAVGKKLEAAVATRLLHEGVSSVVAMAYTVYAVAAAEFMAAFYERLFAGGTVASAVTAGRQQLFRRPGRPSPKGELPLADWLVPVHYSRREVNFPQAVVPRSVDLPSLSEALAAVTAEPEQPGLSDLDAVDGVFIGRDALFYELEVAIRRQKVVALIGPGGTGKTELAKAFGRWWRDTGGVEAPDWVLWHSFEPGVATFGLDGVINDIGLKLYGPEFDLLEAEQRSATVRDALADHRMLLIWDNFESVRSMPDPGRATPPLDEDGCSELQEFLAGLAVQGKSSVLITSRTSEDWLGQVHSIPVRGLAVHEATDYADALLAPHPVARSRRESRAFGDLMAWLDGHPLAMRLILPRLEVTSPEALLASLRGDRPLPGADSAGQGRTDSLAASLGYSYTHLPESVRRLLPAISLFQGVADASVLGQFSAAPEVPSRFAGVTKSDWGEILKDAARVGLLTSIAGNIYAIHPALPGYLATAWRSAEPADHETIREAATNALLSAYEHLSRWLFKETQEGDAALAYAVIKLHQRTMGRILAYALDHGSWEAAQRILQPLDDYWAARGLDVEADAWADRARIATESPAGIVPGRSTPQGALWAYATGNQANRQLRHQQFDKAEQAHSQALASLQSQEVSPDQRRHMAITYHQLGRVAMERGQLNKADELFRKALALTREDGDRKIRATVYHQLGAIAHDRGRLDEAEQSHLRALDFAEEDGDQLGIARACHELGMVSEAQGRLEEAENWLRKALVIEERASNRPYLVSTYMHLGKVVHGQGRLAEAQDWYLRMLTLAEKGRNRLDVIRAYHQLGMVAQGRGRLDEAEQWYLKALKLENEANFREGVATTQHQLGTIAQEMARLDGAEEWYRKALAIWLEDGNAPGVARTSGQLGMLAEEQGHLPNALAWMIRCVAAFDEFPHPMTRPGPSQLARLAGILGIEALEGNWREVTGNALPQVVRDYVKAQLQERGNSGE